MRSSCDLGSSMITRRSNESHLASYFGHSITEWWASSNLPAPHAAQVRRSRGQGGVASRPTRPINGKQPSIGCPWYSTDHQGIVQVHLARFCTPQPLRRSPPPGSIPIFHIHKHTQTHTNTHKHTQTHTNTHKHTGVLPESLRILHMGDNFNR